MEKDIFESKIFKIIILSIAGLIVMVLIFGLGFVAGTKRAEFSFKWANEYHRNFGGPQNGFFGNMMGNNFINDSGVFGEILKIDGQNLTIEGVDNLEKSVLVGEKTSIVEQRRNLKISDLTVGDNVVVIGNPNSSGQISAHLIRVMPQPPEIPGTLKN